MRHLRCGALLAACTAILVFGGEVRFAAQSPRSVPLGAGRPDTPGVTRTPLRDDAKSSVVRVRFESGAKEPPHTHPYDVLLIPLADRAVDFNIGGESIKTLKVGVVKFIPRDVTHYLANVGQEPLDFVTVALK